MDIYRTLLYTRTGKADCFCKKRKIGLKQGILYLCAATAMILLCVLLTPGKESEKSVHYSGGSTLDSDIAEWIRTNGIVK